MNKLISKILIAAFTLSLFNFVVLVSADDTTPYSKGYIEGHIVKINIPTPTPEPSNTPKPTPTPAAEDALEEPVPEEIPVSTITIEQYDGSIHLLGFVEEPVLKIDNKMTVLTDFKPGMEVYAELRGDGISLMESYSTAVPGFIPEGSKIRSGLVKQVDRDQIVISRDGADETYFISPVTIVNKEGVVAPISTLYEGDNVKLFFDDVNSTTVSRITIDSRYTKVSAVYKGIIASAPAVGNTLTVGHTLTLTNVEQLKNKGWEAITGSKNTKAIKYATGTPVSMGGYEISPSNMKYYIGKTVYIAASNFFGSEQAQKMVIKNQFESTYWEKITNINWYSDALKLSNTKNLNFYDGTIIINNDRLVDKYALETGMDAMVVGDGRTMNLNADLVYVYGSSINNPGVGQNYFYEGRISEIGMNNVLLENFCVLDKNEWQSFGGTKELYYDSECFVYDMINGRQLTIEEFYAGEYAIDPNRLSNTELTRRSWYAYAYTDGDIIRAIIINNRRDSLLNQVVNTGVISNLEQDELYGWRMDIDNATTWSTRNQRWIARNSAIPINLSGAIIVRDNVALIPDQLVADGGGSNDASFYRPNPTDQTATSAGDLGEGDSAYYRHNPPIKKGDSVYVVRDGTQGKLILVK